MRRFPNIVSWTTLVAILALGLVGCSREPRPSISEPAAASGPVAGDAAVERVEREVCGRLESLLHRQRSRCGCAETASLSRACMDGLRDALPEGVAPESLIVDESELRCCLSDLDREMQDCGSVQMPAACRGILRAPSARSQGYCGIAQLREGEGCQFDGDCVANLVCHGDDEGLCGPEPCAKPDAASCVPPLCAPDGRLHWRR